MMSQMNTKVRLVRCPKCWVVLPELADVPIYKCGGCGTSLQAKNRKNETKDTGSDLRETDSPQKNKLDHVSDGKSARRRSNEHATLPSTGESSPDKTRDTGLTDPGQKNKPDHVSDNKGARRSSEVEEYNQEQPGGGNLSNELPRSSELICQDNVELSPKVRVHMDPDEDACSWDHYNGGEENESGDCNRKRLGGGAFPNLLTRSTELSCHENGESAPEAQTHMQLDEDKWHLDQYSGRHQNGNGDCVGGTGDTNSSLEVSSSIDFNDRGSSSPGIGVHVEVDDSKYSLDQNNGSDQSINDRGSSSPGIGVHVEVDDSKYYLDQNNGSDQSKLNDCTGDVPGNMNGSNEVLLSTALICHEIEEQSTLAMDETDVDVDEDFKSHFIFRSSSAEDPLATTGDSFTTAQRTLDTRDSFTTSQRTLDDSISSDYLTSPPKEHLEQSQKSILESFNRVSSEDTLENLPLVNPSSDINVELLDIYRSPKSRSNHAYYDGSVSSFDGTDDQVPDQNTHQSKSKSKEVDFVSANGLHTRNEFIMNDMMGSDSKMHHQAMIDSSITVGKKHHAMKGTKWHRDELPLPTRHSYPFRGRMRPEKDECEPRMPFYSRGSPSGHGNGGNPSLRGHMEFENQYRHHSSDESEYPEPDKSELLRMVYELKDQLNRTYISKANENRTFPTGVNVIENHIPLYYNHLASDGDIYHGKNYPGYPGRYMRGKNLPEHCKMTRMAFSGEVTHSRFQIDCSCLHCCPENCRYSAQLPPHFFYCNKRNMSQLGQNSCNPYVSSPSSPQHYTNSEFSEWSHNIMPGDQPKRNLDVKKVYQGEKRHSMKRHFRPVAGGAPLIACYHCLELLQLPADVLLFGRRCHRLRCSACNEVLIFSLQNRTRLVPYNPGAIAPPPSEVDDYNYAINKRNVAAASRANDSPHAEPVSCSDDYEPVSCSTEGDHFSLDPLQTQKRNYNHRKMSSGGSFEPMEERKMSVSKEHNRYTNPVVESAGPSSNITSWEKSSSEIKKERPTVGSPLHELMGYSSPSEVIKS